MLHPCLGAMLAYPQFINWVPIPRNDGTNKVDKVPFDPRTITKIDAHNPAVWMPADDAVAIAQAHKAQNIGVGFVFTAADPFFFLDLDACVGKDGRASELAAHLRSRLPGAATEVSISGEGLHIFGSCAGDFLHAKKNVPLHIELYRDKRFVALGSSYGGGWCEGDVGLDCTAQIEALAAQYFPGGKFDLVDWRDEAVEGYRSPMSDDQIIKAACASTSAREAFGEAVSFADLWDCNVEKLAVAFPSSTDDDFDRSSADYSLIARLCFWTGKNHERILTLLARSGLMREKWSRDGYIKKSIMRAVGSYYGDVLGETDLVVTPPPGVGVPLEVPAVVTPLDAPAVVTPLDEIATRTGRQMYFPDDQRTYFQGCVALPSMGKIHVPGRGLLGQVGFKMLFDGPAFVMSDANGAKTVSNSWEAFTGSETNIAPTAHGLTFKPAGPTLVHEFDETFVNTWRPITIPRVRGDASPFVDHVLRMLPDGDDARLLISYLAACVQNPGVKFAWCPIVQGVQGNGKSTIAACVEFAIGPKYVHQGKASQFTKDFNSWLADRVLVIVDDVKISAGRADVMERIKPLITQDRQSVERKGIDAQTQAVCCNFLLTSNHKDALVFSRDERRFAAFFCAQQEFADLERDGMTQEYFSTLRDWLLRKDGYAIVAEYLHTVAIPDELNPAVGAGRAPATTSQAVAIFESMSLEVQHVEAAIAEEQPGFRDGWLSTIRIRDLFEARRVGVTPRQFSRYAKALGYVRHPALSDGRAGRLIAEELGRPKLYVRQNHIALNEDDRGRVVDLYCKAQGYTTKLPLEALA